MVTNLRLRREQQILQMILGINADIGKLDAKKDILIAKRNKLEDELVRLSK